MDELVGDHAPWDLDKHLSGCLRGYQTDPSYGAAVYFALEALWGIAREVAVRANAGKVDPDQLDADWIICPNTGWTERLRRRRRSRSGLRVGVSGRCRDRGPGV
jgi:hypothetical protein